VTDNQTQRFKQGEAAASEVLQDHAMVPFPDPTVREQVFWFFVGVRAADQYGCNTPEDFEAFVLGVGGRAPASAGAHAVDAIREAAQRADNRGDHQHAKGLYDAISVLAAHGIVSDK
jgi:hypothetical protein